MNQTTKLGPWTITIRQERIEIPPSLEPETDPDWRYVDKAGHGHFWQDGYPTLHWVSAPCSWDHGDDCTAEGNYLCPHCGEPIDPGTRAPSGAPTYIPGPIDARVTYDNGLEQRVYLVETQEELELLRRDPVAGINAIAKHEPIEESRSR